MSATTATPRKTVRRRPEKTLKKRRKITPKSTEVTFGHGNTKGLPALPVELHLEIISSIPSVPVPCPSSGILSGEYRDKFDAMYALSQTCSALYHVYNPLLWKSLEVCATRDRLNKSRSLAKKMATELVSQIEVVTIRAPHLAEFVQVFNVALTAFSSPDVYKEFVRCLHCLPNLHTLQIISFPHSTDDLAPQKSLKSLTRAFAQACVPSVKTLTLPVEILKPMRVGATFPNLRYLAILDWRYNIRYTDVLELIPRSIHSLHGHPMIFTLSCPPLYLYLEAQKSFFEHLPHLRITPRLPFQRSARLLANRDARVKLLRVSLLSWTHKCPQLHTIQLLEHGASSSNISVDAVVDIAKDVLLRHLQAHENIVEGRINLWRCDNPPAVCPYRVVLVRRPSPD